MMRNWKRLLLKALVVTLLIVGFSAATLYGQSEQGNDNSAEVQNQRIYVCNQGEATLSVIDVASNEVVDKIDLQELGFSVNAKPHHAVAEPDGSFWYVTLIGANRVLKFNRDNELVGQAEMEVPGLLSLHPDREVLMVGRSMSAVNPPQSIGIINRSDMMVQREVPTFFARPHAITTAPNGKWTYIASLADNQILSINNATDETELTTLDGETHVFVDFAISPDGNTMVVTGQISSKLLFFDMNKPESPKFTGSIDVNVQPWHPEFSPDGKYVYFGNKQAHTVTVVNIESRSVEAVVEGTGLAQPHGSAMSADGQYLYISNNNRKGTFDSEGTSAAGDPNGTVTVIDTETNEIVKVIEVGAYPSGIGTNARW